MDAARYKGIKSPVVDYKGQKGKWYHGHFFSPEGDLLINGNTINADEKVTEHVISEPVESKSKSKKKDKKSKAIDEPEMELEPEMESKQDSDNEYAQSFD